MVQVRVEQGILEGAEVETVTKDGRYYSFKGIPYAAPPVGKLRFKAPEPLLPWDGVKKATEHGPNCPQIDIFTKQFKLGSEDCLYLNVYSPNLTPSAKLPVMFFIHGGGLKSGSGDDDNYGPDFLVNHGVVVVTINYRLETFGFLCLDTKEVPGNAGMKDQVAALKWVNKNIANFGGDSKNITVFGESAGGASTACHMLSPLSKGLFQRAIIMSGSPFCEWAIPFEPRKRAFKLGEQLGLETNDSDELLEFLQSVPTEKLINVNPCIVSFEDNCNHPLKMYHFTTVIEKDFGQEAFLTNDVEEILMKGEVNDVDVMIGYTSQECLLVFIDLNFFYSKYQLLDEIYVPRKILYNGTSANILKAAQVIKEHFFNGIKVDNTKLKEFLQYSSETAIINGVQKLMTLLTNVSKCKVLAYRFSAVSERNIFGNLGKDFGFTGAAHCDDLMYIFNANQHKQPVDKNSRSYKLVLKVCGLFTNFAKFGNPTPDSSMDITWPEYDNKDKMYVDINDTLSIREKFDEDVVEFWKNIYKLSDVPF